MRRRNAIAVITSVFLLSIPVEGTAQLQDTGALRVHPQNARYFTNDSGRAILLCGSHTWNNLVDMGPTDPPPAFDFEAHLQWMVNHHHNFCRLWTWELLTWDTRGNREEQAEIHRVFPHPWRRTGPGLALDGKPKFDLQQYDDEYFSRLRHRVRAAEEHGVYVAVMLFEGWGMQFSPDAWKNHFFHPDNNISGIDGDLNGDGMGLEVHTLQSEEVTRVQQEYVRKVIDTVNEFDNVLYEISNENHPPSTQWQYAFIEFIKEYEQSKPKQHPVGMTFQYKGGSNATLFESPADWISPNTEGGYRDNPPAGDGQKVIITDTDHLWGIGGNPTWVWKSFLRGLNPIFMDPYDGRVLRKGFDPEWADPIRKAMGYALDWSRRIDLAATTPRADLASSEYCLANPGTEYLVLVPADSKSVTLTLPPGRYEWLWFNTANGKESAKETLDQRDDQWQASSPFAADALLHMRRIP